MAKDKATQAKDKAATSAAKKAADKKAADAKKAADKKAADKKAKEAARAKPKPTTLRNIGSALKKAEKDLAGTDTISKGKKEALAGAKALVDIVGTNMLKDGKQTPLGHQAHRINGMIDRAILESATSGDIDIASILKSIAKENPPSRRTAVDDNKGLVKRCVSHLKYTSGRKSDHQTSRYGALLKKLGYNKDQQAKIMASVKPWALYFEQMTGAANW